MIKDLEYKGKFTKKVEEIKKMQEEKNLFLFGFENPEKDIPYKILKVVNYLFDGYPVIEEINFKVKKGWLYIKGKGLNKDKAIQLRFSPYKEGYVRKIFNNKNQFIFKIN